MRAKISEATCILLEICGSFARRGSGKKKLFQLEGYAHMAKVSAIPTFLNNPRDRMKKPTAMFLEFMYLLAFFANWGIISL